MSNEERKARRPRGTGSVYRRKGSAVWQAKYYRDGEVFRQSTGETTRWKAEKFLQKKLGEIATATFIEPKVEKIKVQELAEDLIREYSINRRKSLVDLKIRWEKHLAPVFGSLRATHVGSSLIARYIDQRQKEGAANATINREMAVLKRLYNLGRQNRKVREVPILPHLKENNIRQGFLDDGQFQNLVEGSDLWFRAIVECARTYAWRLSELVNMRVSQVDLFSRQIRLEPGTTKNDEGRTVEMTDAVYTLLSECIRGKGSDARVFTRKDGKPVQNFRKFWANVCCAAGLGQMVCPKCEKAVDLSARCESCAVEWKRKALRYKGLLFHDLRRTGARNHRRTGTSEGVIMKIGGWKTRSVFDRYNIVDQRDVADAMRKYEEAQRVRDTEFGHSLGTVDPSSTQIAKKADVN